MFEDCNDWALELYPKKDKKITELCSDDGMSYEAPKFSGFKFLRQTPAGLIQGTIDGVNWIDDECRYNRSLPEYNNEDDETKSVEVKIKTETKTYKLQWVEIDG